MGKHKEWLLFPNDILPLNITSLEEELRNEMAEFIQKKEFALMSRIIMADIEQKTGLKNLFKKLKEEKNVRNK